jgi:lysozyme family protein
MDGLVEDFYWENFWDPLSGEPEFSDMTKQKFFDTSVNTGLCKAIIFLQEALNTLGAGLALDVAIEAR